MTKRKLLLIFGGLLVTAGLAAISRLVFLKLQTSTPGALQINSVPKSVIYLNDREVGQTPFFNEKIDPGEYRLKLSPASNLNSSLPPWEMSIKVGSGTLTYVSREIGPSNDTSSGQILTLEKLPNSRQSELALISDPDGTVISIDGLEKGKASMVLHGITPTDHVILVTLSGYEDKVIQARLVAGYRLNVSLKLRKLNSAQISAPKSTEELIASPSALTTPASFVTVKENPLGFLRVRTLPDFTASEAGKVYPGDKYPLISETAGWIKIKMGNDSGWVSDQYVDITR